MTLTDFVIQKKSKAGRYTDDKTKGLHLWVKPSMQKYWVFRYTFKGKRQGMGLGVYPAVTLKMAREKAIVARLAVNQGVSPIQAKKQASHLQEASKAPTFRDFALDYIETMKPKWRNEKHADQWVSTVTAYAFPVIGDLPLDEIDTTHILQILQPIWLTKSETASRLRGRIERILSASITRKYRIAVNPAMWKGHLENLMPPPKSSDRHHEALPYDQLPEFMATLREMDSLSALALEFTILNASRTGEVIKGLRSEVKEGVWTIPGSRMKAGKPHQVPLNQRSVDILTITQSLDPDSQYLFSRNSKPLSNMAMLMMARRQRDGLTVHGFRSTFRDWISEETEHSPEVAEMALAHTIGNKVERAYRRGNLLESRRRLMNDWASFCLTGRWGNVINFPERKTA
ncbi:MAG: tyrosine-type recombinase/integrase [Burkholderiaceae bacterium]